MKSSNSDSFQQFVGRCRQRGLEVVDAEAKGEVLLVTPEPDSELPDVSALQGLVDRCEIEDIRYVALDLEVYCEKRRWETDDD